MELFQKLSELLNDNCTLSINVAKKDDRLIVSVLPGNSLVKDTAATNIVPLNISGTGKELDEGFVAAVFEPLKRVTGLLMDMQSFEEAEEAARQKSKMEAKKKTEEQEKKQFSGYVELAKINLAESKFRDALTCIERARDFVSCDNDTKALDNLKTKVNNDSGIGSMFGGPEDKSDGKNVKVKGSTAPKPMAPESDEEESDDNEE